MKNYNLSGLLLLRPTEVVVVLKINNDILCGIRQVPRSNNAKSSVKVAVKKKIEKR